MVSVILEQGNNKYNTLPRRVIARLFDFGLIFGVFYLIELGFSFDEYVFKYVIAVVYFFYYIYTLTRYSQTLGMYIAGTYLIDVHTKKEPRISQIVLREVLGSYIVLLSLLILERYAQGQGDKLRLFFYTQTSWLILQFLVVVISNRHRTIHDFVAQTVVIKVLPFGIKPKPRHEIR